MRYVIYFVNEYGVGKKIKRIKWGLMTKCLCGKDISCWIDFEVENAEVLAKRDLCSCGKETYFIVEDRYNNVQVMIVRDGRYVEGFKVFDVEYDLEVIKYDNEGDEIYMVGGEVEKVETGMDY